MQIISTERRESHRNYYRLVKYKYKCIDKNKGNKFPITNVKSMEWVLCEIKNTWKK